MDNHIFCNCNKSEIITENELAFAVLDKFPVNEGRDIFKAFLKPIEKDKSHIQSLT